MNPQRFSVGNAIGALISAGLWVPGLSLTYIGIIERVVLFGLLVIVPLGYRLHVMDHGRAGALLRYHLVNALLLPAGLLTVVSFLWPPGILPMLLVLPWFAVTAMTARVGFLTRKEACASPELLCRTASLAYIIVGGVALVLARAGITLGFPEVIIVLTVVHFHFAGFAGPLIAAEVLRNTRKRVSLPVQRIIAGGVAVAPVFVGIGITFTNRIELPAALSVAGAYMFLAYVMVRYSTGVRPLMLTAAVALFLAMATAIAYAVGHFMENEIILITDMAWTHGILNAFGFVLCGLLGIRFSQKRRALPDIPFSRVFGKWNQSTQPDNPNPPPGAVDDFRIFRSAGFTPSAADPAISRFYERAGEYRLDLLSTWHIPFPGKLLFRVFSLLTGEFNFPRRAGLHQVHTVFHRMPEHFEDSRPGARVCVRYYDSSPQDVLYVPLYAYHRARGVTYMNVAFPAPLGNITGVLRPENLPNGAMRLSCGGKQPGHEGIYFVAVPGAVRLPIQSNITLWPAHALPDSVPSVVRNARPELVAVNDIRIFGLHVCSVYYAIWTLSPRTEDRMSAFQTR